jgi:hypothetical protein
MSSLAVNIWALQSVLQSTSRQERPRYGRNNYNDIPNKNLGGGRGPQTDKLLPPSPLQVKFSRKDDI